MLLETLLPLGKVDPGLRAPEVPLDLASIGRDARLLEEIGYEGLVVEETKDDPFVLMALAAQATQRLKIGTSVAMPPRLAELIRPGERFSWKVAAFDDAAQPVRGSGWVEATREK